MEASIVDLRYHMNDILKALDRQEEVKIYYHGKFKATLVPAKKNQKEEKEITAHPFFGMKKQDKQSVSKEMQKLRGGRYDDL